MAVRDDIDKIPGTAIGRRYARMKGGGGAKQAKLYGELQASTVGKKFNSPMKAQDVGEWTDGRKLPESSPLVRRLMGEDKDAEVSVTIKVKGEGAHQFKQFAQDLASFCNMGCSRTLAVLDSGHPADETPSWDFDGDGNTRITVE
jgi:hypothetical protein